MDRVASTTMSPVTRWLSSDAFVLTAWGVAALVISTLLIPLCRAIAFRYGCVARPREDRWHRNPTPLLGGAAIAVTAIGLAALSGDVVALALPLATGFLVCAVGITDDVISLKPATKLIAEIALASIFVLAG